MIYMYVCKILLNDCIDFFIYFLQELTNHTKNCYLFLGNFEINKEMTFWKTKNLLFLLWFIITALVWHILIVHYFSYQNKNIIKVFKWKSFFFDQWTSCNFQKNAKYRHSLTTDYNLFSSVDIQNLTQCLFGCEYEWLNQSANYFISPKPELSQRPVGWLELYTKKPDRSI